MKNILVTGSNGQLGSELRALADHYPDYNMIFTDLEELDITNNNAINSFLQHQPVNILINCAAYTFVDKAEEEPSKSGLLNSKGPFLLSKAAENYNFQLFHISTDYVFSGKQFRPYNEEDIPDPDSAYGISKFAGEEAIMQSVANALIIRTSWLYSAYGNNFAKTIIKLAGEKKEISVVSDQVGTPTYAADLANFILDIVGKHVITGRKIYHYSNEGVCSWYDFARTIIELEGLECTVRPIRTAEYPTQAPRPLYSVLDKSRIKNDFQINIPWWKDSLLLCLDKIRLENKPG